MKRRGNTLKSVPLAVTLAVKGDKRCLELRTWPRGINQVSVGKEDMENEYWV